MTTASTTASVSLIISNCPPDAAESIAQELVKRRQAACVTLSPVKSIYRWQGEICIDSEVTLTAKVSASHVKACVSALRELHPYELPEILVLNTEPSSLDEYCAWVDDECGPQRDS
jgi:periplasmic divalent cation tolerance protein